MGSKSLIFQLLAVLLLSTVGIVAYEVFPRKTLDLLVVRNMYIELMPSYSAEQNAVGRWVDKASFHFRCQFKTIANQACGLNMFFSDANGRGLDLSAYNSLNIAANISGETETVRIYLRNFNGAYATLEDANSSTYLSLPLSLEEFLPVDLVEIGMNEFAIAEWWLSQRNIPRKYRTPEFDNVMALGFDFSPYASPGHTLEMDIQRLYMSGPLIYRDSWYLGILLILLACISAIIVSRVVVVIRERELLVSEYQRVERQSLSDHLTSALNRHGLESEIQRLKNTSDLNDVLLVVLDIDHFKSVNDTFGHDAGDEVLQQFARRVKSCIRENDVFARWGGEEFVVLAPLVSESLAFNFVEKLRLFIAKENFLGNKKIQITSSFGYTYWGSVEAFDTAFKRADEALYRAKKGGRNICVAG
ncbi:GGDEF domain-containing protein [Teredinibacter franksiae]|uniref:GGDEF domain-containing protein n=1 Tax=Teredinibacter franksiae TaxID=2761453 RepID=UPI0016232B03|nr:GGDEF domain-containing protein [Teredinibacter franksiae]